MDQHFSLYSVKFTHLQCCQASHFGASSGIFFSSLVTKKRSGIQHFFLASLFFHIIIHNSINICLSYYFRKATTSLMCSVCSFLFYSFSLNTYHFVTNKSIVFKCDKLVWASNSGPTTETKSRFGLKFLIFNCRYLYLFYVYV